MKLRYTIFYLLIIFLCACTQNSSLQGIRIVSWGGIPAENADTLYSLAKECGFDTHLGLYRLQESALASMDAAERAGMRIIISFPQIKDSTEFAVPLIKEHPALLAYHLKDEPDTSDFAMLKELQEKVKSIDPEHPCYINLFPNWAWGEEEYVEKLELFASSIDVPFYSFDHYPIIEVDGKVFVRPQWYRNLEEFYAMAKKHNKPFWGFALATTHSIVEPEETYYPEPTLGQIRLQVFSNLLYGAQAIQYFTFAGIVDSKTLQKKQAFEIIRHVNSEIHAYSDVFAGCKVLGVWHTGDTIPSHTRRLTKMPHRKLKSLEISGKGAVVSLIENNGNTYLAVQNQDPENEAVLKSSFNGGVKVVNSDKERRHDYIHAVIEPGNIIIYKL